MIDLNITMVDSGLFTELAVKLATQTSGKVRSWVPWEAEFPAVNDRMMGDGLGVIERIEDALDPDVVDDTDLYVFPDIFRYGTQLTLERIGKLVWGSRKGDRLETERLMFRKLQEKLGLPVPEYTAVRGISSLRDFLKDHGHCFVKTDPKIRGTMETWEHWDYEQSEYHLDNLAVKLGASKEIVLFMVEEPIETKFETGFDTHSIDGQFSETPIQGIEIKGHLIFCSAQIKGRTPPFIDKAMRALGPWLERRRYRNFMSAEFREDMLVDPCCRCPNPGIGCEMEMISNLGEIVEAGARGELIEPDFEYEFGVQAAIFHDGSEDHWKQFRLEPEIRRWVKLMEFCQVGECYNIIPRPPHGKKIGWLVGVGNTIEEMTEHLQANAKALKNYPFDIKTDALWEALEQAKVAESEGIEFSDQPIPEPAEVIEG